MAAWMARWCPFSYTDQLGAAEGRARAVMTADGWAQFDPVARDRARDSWAKTVAAKEAGRCSAPAVTISPEAPRSGNSAIVIGVADRVISGARTAPYVEHVGGTRVVLRGSDGRWRVDTATQGG